MKINIEVKETLSRVVSVDAETVAEAIYKAEDMYRKEDIVLDYADFEGNVEIENATN
jgi:hypothetical protein